MSKPLKRKIHLPSGVWTYVIGQKSVKIRNPECTKSYVVDFSKISGLDWEAIDHDMWKGNFCITPSQIQDYVTKELCTKEQTNTHTTQKEKISA